MTIKILAHARTTSLDDAIATFVAATDQNGAFAPRAMRELLESQRDSNTGDTFDWWSLADLVIAANAITQWRAGTRRRLVQPAKIEHTASDGKLSRLLQRPLGAVATTYGSGVSWVSLFTPYPGHLNDHKAIKRRRGEEEYHLVVWIDDRDDSWAVPPEEYEERWGYLMTPVRALAEKAS